MPLSRFLDTLEGRIGPSKEMSRFQTYRHGIQAEIVAAASVLAVSTFAKADVNIEGASEFRQSFSNQ